MRKFLIVPALAALVIGEQAAAEGFDYTYVQGSVLGSKVKAGGDSDGGKGFRLEGAISNDQPIFLFFSFARNQYSGDSDDLKFRNSTAGLGGHLALGSNIDLVGGVSFENIKIKPFVSYSPTPPPPPPPSPPPKDNSSSRNGLGLMVGLRMHAGEKLEWNAGLKYRDIEYIDPIIGITVGARYQFTPAIALSVDANHEIYDSSTLDATETILAVGVRYRFGIN